MPDIDRFLDDTLTPDPHGRVQAALLYRHYLRWAVRQPSHLGGHALTQTSFGRAVAARLPRQRFDSRRYYLGVTLTRP